MKKNNPEDNTRIDIIIGLFVEMEMQRFSKVKNVSTVKRYFRYVHLGNRLKRKISSANNVTFILRSADIEIKIIKGSGSIVPKIVEIKNNELCWQKD